MSTVDQMMLARHRALIESQDEEPLGQLPPEEQLTRRLQRSGVLLLADGALGQAVVGMLSQLPLRVLAIQALQADQLSSFEALKPHLPRHAMVMPMAWQARNLAARVFRSQLVVIAAERPYPPILAQINKVCQRVRLPWLAATQWGAEMIVGPSFLPGVTACHECYRRRLRSNEERSDVMAAREQYFSNEQQHHLQGQLSPLLMQTAAQVAVEVQRLLTAVTPPSTLNAELYSNAVAGVSGRHWVVPVDLCPVCSGDQQLPGEGLADVVRRLVQSEEAAC